MPTKRKWTDEEIFAEVQELLVDALGVDDDEVTPSAVLTDDLGAESIDFLDIVFRLEQAFEIKIEQGELFPDDLLSEDDVEAESPWRVRKERVSWVVERFPHSDMTEWVKNPLIDDLHKVFTVQSVCNHVKSKL